MGQEFVIHFQLSPAEFDLSKYLYKEFEKSEFYDKSQEDDLETCIIEYLENKYNRVDLDLDTEIDDDY